MLPSTPSDLLWDTLAPLLQLQEALQGLLDACAAYLPWCVGGAVGLAFLVLTGLVLFELQGGGDRATRFTFAEESTPAQ